MKKQRIIGCALIIVASVVIVASAVAGTNPLRCRRVFIGSLGVWMVTAKEHILYDSRIRNEKQGGKGRAKRPAPSPFYR